MKLWMGSAPGHIVASQLLRLAGQPLVAPFCSNSSKRLICSAATACGRVRQCSCVDDGCTMKDSRSCQAQKPDPSSRTSGGVSVTKSLGALQPPSNVCDSNSLRKAAEDLHAMHSTQSR